MEARAAGDDLHVLHAREQFGRVDAEDVRQDAVVRDASLERVGDRARLLEDFLQHVVAVLAALDRVGGHLALAHRALGRPAIAVEDAETVERDLDEVAFLEVGEMGGLADQRLHVGAEVVLAFADADHQRASAARADHVAGLVAVHHRDRIRAVQSASRGEHRVAQLGAARERVVDEVRDDLGVGIGFERVALGLEFGAQFRVVLDDAVVHDRDALARHVRMRVDGVRHAMRGPARVRDAGHAGDRRGLVQRLEFAHLALGAHAREAPVFQHRDAGRIVAAVFKRLETGDQQRDHVTLGDGGDDSTHGRLPRVRVTACAGRCRDDRGSRAGVGTGGRSLAAAQGSNLTKCGVFHGLPTCGWMRRLC